VTTAVSKWREDLASWAIPREILDGAETKPWIHPPAVFQIPNVIPDSPSLQRIREGLTDGGSILDVGCGGGIASFGGTPPATHVIGLDQQQEMLDLYSQNAKKFNVSSETFLGDWPDVAGQVPSADVVVAFHVVYNVGDIKPFIEALDSHAKKRVVLELPTAHPMTAMASGWKHFWNLVRPTKPTAEDLMMVISEMGINANIEYFTGSILLDKVISEFEKPLRIRLCLPESREEEVKAYFTQNPLPTTRDLAVIWWDK
jgi:SAM-dependent methyltransferase